MVIIVFQNIQTYLESSFYEYEIVAKTCKLSVGQLTLWDVMQELLNSGLKLLISKEFHVFLCMTIGLNLLFIQMDELWSYLKNTSIMDIYRP